MRLTVLMLTVLMLTALLAASADAGELVEIENFYAIDERLATAGQVKPEHVPALSAAGFDMVINLAPADEKNNAREGFLIAGQNMAYANIPVIWEQPTQQDLQLFFAMMDASGGRKVLVHCFANYRASAFTYLYRVLRLGIAEPEARKGLDRVWSDEAFAAYPVWREFIDTALGTNAGRP